MTNQSKDEDLKRQVHQLIVKGNLGGTIGELRDDLLKLIRNYGYSERLEELDRQSPMFSIYNRERKAELKAAIEEIN